MSDKYVVPDTNVYLHSPESIDEIIKTYDNFNLVLATQAIRELESIKSEMGTSRGKRAREISQVIMSKAKLGDLSKGIKVSENCNFVSEYGLDIKKCRDATEIFGNVHDIGLLQIIVNLKDAGKDVLFLTNDSQAYIYANSIGVKTENWGETLEGEAYKGWRIVDLQPSHINYLKKHDGFMSYDELSQEVEGLENLMPNEFILPNPEVCGVERVPLIFKNFETNPGFEMLHHYNKKLSPVQALKIKDVPLVEMLQKCYMHALRDPEIDLVFAIGEAGTAKTFLAVDAGIEQCFYNYGENPVRGVEKHVKQIERSNFETLLVTRPFVSVKSQATKMGEVPGDMNEKTQRWHQAIEDHFSKLWKEYNIDKGEVEEIEESGKKDILVSEFMRGRDLRNLFWIIDEAQNFEHFELYTGLTRVSEKAKLILTGDPSQSDLKYTAGLADSILWCNQRFMDYKGSATITFPESCVVRSGLAREAIKRLGKDFRRK